MYSVMYLWLLAIKLAFFFSCFWLTEQRFLTGTMSKLGLNAVVLVSATSGYASARVVLLLCM